MYVTIEDERGFYFYFGKFGKSISNWKFLTCTSDKVVYLAICAACGLQGVGSTINLKLDLPITSLKSNIIGEPVVLLITSWIIIMLIIHC